MDAMARWPDAASHSPTELDKPMMMGRTARRSRGSDGGTCTCAGARDEELCSHRRAHDGSSPVTASTATSRQAAAGAAFLAAAIVLHATYANHNTHRLAARNSASQNTGSSAAVKATSSGDGTGAIRAAARHFNDSSNALRGSNRVANAFKYMEMPKPQNTTPSSAKTHALRRVHPFSADRCCTSTAGVIGGATTAGGASVTIGAQSPGSTAAMSAIKLPATFA